MKTSIGEKREFNFKMFHPGINSMLGFAIIILLTLSSWSLKAVAQRVEIQASIELPSWAPYYGNPQLVRYYYLPDIECYYDVRNHEFIYMEDGEWMFGRSLPRIYSWFDLNNCFIVALDARVIEPWRHFHYYVAHYPRYYYRTVYRDIYRDRDRPIRGFNENERNVVYNRRSDRDDHTYNRKIDVGREDNDRRELKREVTNRNDNKQTNEVRRDYPERRVEPTHPAEPVKYYGKDVGRPVKVQRNMKKIQEIKVREDKHYRER